MRLTTLLTSLLALPAALAQTHATNGMGSTPAQRHIISSSQALLLIHSAVSSASALNVPQNIAVVDPSGSLVAFLHMDNAYLGSIDLAQKKARTVVLFNGLTSAQAYGLAQPGGPNFGIENTNGGLVVFGGGLPIYSRNRLIGAIGVSGGSVEQDVQVAKEALAAFAQAKP